MRSIFRFACATTVVATTIALVAILAIPSPSASAPQRGHFEQHQEHTWEGVSNCVRQHGEGYGCADWIDDNLGITTMRCCVHESRINLADPGDCYGHLQVN